MILRGILFLLNQNSVMDYDGYRSQLNYIHVSKSIQQEYFMWPSDLRRFAPLHNECLKSGTYAKGKDSNVEKVMNGIPENHKLTQMVERCLCTLF